MDSGNSGSMQSSSGGDEEYDSRSESISGFLNNQTAPQFGCGGSIPNNQQPPPTFFDSFSHPPTNPNQNPLYNLDLPWTRNPNYSDFSTQSLLGAQSVSQGQLQSSSGMPPQVFDESQQRAPPPEPTKVKNPKKRTRASRRAPTTVLTTDTTNFRQMVQEFTGIPAAPFSAASSYSRRLDLFGTAGSTMGSLYPLRPSFQKTPLPTQLKHPLGDNAPIFGAKPPLDGLGMGQWRGTLDSSSAHLGSFDRNNNGNRESCSVGGSGSGYKLNSSTEAGSDFQPHKISSLGNGSSSRGGGEGGTLDSWICPSD